MTEIYRALIHSPMVQRKMLGFLGWLGLVYSLIYCALTLLPQNQWLDGRGAMSVFLPLVLTPLVLSAIRGLTQLSQRGWALLAIALFVHLLSGLFFGMNIHMGGFSMGSVVWGEWLAIFSSLIFLFGMVCFSDGSHCRGLVLMDRMLLLVSLVMLLACALAAQFGFDQVGSPVSTPFSLANLIVSINLVLIFVVGYLIFDQRFYLTGNWWVFLMGVTAYAVSNVVRFHPALQAGEGAGLFIDLSSLFFIASITFVSWRGLTQLKRNISVPYFVPVTYGSALLVSALVLYASQVGTGAGAMRIVALVALSFVGLRLILTLRDHSKAMDVRQPHLIDVETNLPTRQGIIDLYRAYLAHSPQPAGWSLMVVEVDGWRELSASVGHASAAELLQRLGAALKNSLRASEMMGRIGDARFLVLVPHHDLLDPVAVAERLLHAGARRQMLGGQFFDVTVSIGFTSEMRARPKIDLLLQQADQALIHSRRDGIAQIGSFNGKDC